MFNSAAKTLSRMRPVLQRVLIVDPDDAAARMLGELLRAACGPEIWAAASLDKGLRLAGKVGPDVIFCELAADGFDGGEFTRALRRSDLACRRAPVVLTSRAAAPAQILAGRDAGAHEFLRKPFTAKDLTRRLEAVTLQPRDWVEAVDYVGPDRRQFNAGEYAGPLKRATDHAGAPESVRISQALKILSAALGALDRDPPQALRALLAQTTELHVVATAAADHRLASATLDLHSYLHESASAGRAPDGVEAGRRAAALMAYLPREDRAAA